MAYKNRQDYQNLQNQLVEVRAIHAAYRSQRLPTLTFGGYWGVDKVNGTPSHGTFAAVGSLNFPLFAEARPRSRSRMRIPGGAIISWATGWSRYRMAAGSVSIAKAAARRW